MTTSQAEPRCPHCKRDMEEGFLIDRGHHNSQQAAVWIEGKPERAFWTGLKTKGREVWQITSFRCPDCGLLQEFARVPGKGS